MLEMPTCVTDNQQATTYSNQVFWKRIYKSEWLWN